MSDVHVYAAGDLEIVVDGLAVEVWVAASCACLTPEQWREMRGQVDAQLAFVESLPEEAE